MRERLVACDEPLATLLGVAAERESLRSPITDARLPHRRKSIPVPKRAQIDCVIKSPARASTISRISMSRFRSAFSPASPASPDPANRRSSTSALSKSAARKGQSRRAGTGRLQIDHRRAPHRRSRDGRSIAARAHPALHADALSRALRSHPRTFAAQPEAMAQGLTASAFSFNSGSGRCERCSRHRFRKDRDAIPERSLRALRRVRRPPLSAARPAGQLHGKSIHDVLELTVSEAIEFFARIGEDRETLAKSARKCWTKSGSAICGSVSR